MRDIRCWLVTVGLAFTVMTAPAAAQTMEPASGATRFILDTALYALGGCAALLALLGLSVRDIGLVRLQNAPAIGVRSAASICIVAILGWAVGFELAFSVEEAGFLGEFRPWRNQNINPVAIGSAEGARWFYFVGLAALGAVVTSGAAAERVKLWPFAIFAVGYGGLIFPIVTSWVWADGYFSSVWRFKDLSGASVVHMSAGAAALAAIVAIGPRPGRFAAQGFGRLTPTTSLPLTLLGLAFFWLGLLLLNVLGLGSFSSVENVIAASTILANSSIAGAAGFVAALVLTQLIYRRATLIGVTSGAIGGLISVTADPLHASLWQSLLIGGVGGVVVTVAPPFLDRFHLDDVTGAVPAHLLCGLWSCVVAAWTNPDAWLVGQLVSVFAILGFSFVCSLLIWTSMRYSFGVRIASFDPTRARPPAPTEDAVPAE